MANIFILVAGMVPTAIDEVRVYGTAWCTGMGRNHRPLTWFTDQTPDVLVLTMNTAIKDAAIQAAADAGFTVGALDNKTLFAGAVGL